MSGPQPPIDYTSKDWASFVTTMREAAKARMPEWTSTNPNDFGNVLIESWAYVGDILSLYGDRVAAESFLATATQRASVLNLAAQYDYTPRGTSPAKVALVFTLPATAATVIPAGTQVSTSYSPDSDPIIFETDSDVTVAPVAGAGGGATQNITVPATQGVTVDGEVIGTSCGTIEESFSLLQMPVIDGSISISVQESPLAPAQQWVYTDHLLDAGADDNVFSSYTDEFEAVSILFGDGVNGRIPPKGSVVFATYRVGGGDEGNVGEGSIDTLDDASDIVAGASTTLAAHDITVTNQTPATGGAPAESIESIRINAPRSLSALHRAITLGDYSALAMRVQTVAKAKAAGRVYTNIVIYVAPDGGGQPSQALLNEVVGYLQDKKLVGVGVTASTPVYLPIDVNATVRAQDQYTRAAVQKNVQTALDNLFAFDGVDFGQRVSLSSVYSAISKAAGVDFASVDVLSRRGGTTASDIQCADDEIPTLGVVSISVSGGTDVGAGTGVTTTTPGVPVPSTPGQAVLDLQRCDAASTHFELHWAASADADSYLVIISYLSETGSYPDNVVKSVQFGPFTTPNAVIDSPFIDNPDRVPANQGRSVQFIVEAFNGTVGPAAGPALTVPYVCEQPGATVPAPSVPSAPTISSFAATADVSDTHITGSAAWVNGANTSSVTLAYDELDAAGNVITSGAIATATSPETLDFHVSSLTTALRFYVQAYNGPRGPVYGPSVTVEFVVGGSSSIYTGLPDETAVAWTAYARAGDGSITGTVDVTGDNAQQYEVAVEFGNAGGAFVSGGTNTFATGPGPGSTPSTQSIALSGYIPPTGFVATTVRATVTPHNPNGTGPVLQTSHAY